MWHFSNKVGNFRHFIQMSKNYNLNVKFIQYKLFVSIYFIDVRKMNIDNLESTMNQVMFCVTGHLDVLFLRNEQTGLGF